MEERKEVKEKIMGKDNKAEMGEIKQNEVG